jgi:5-methylcytosine-specific restriction endonuclease McrBC regulatory subunit McrC
VPDIVFTRNDDLFIIDAKYKDHWEDLNIKNWNNLEDVIKERHRNDLLQILAYTTGVGQESISCCLVYPCKKETWRSLLKRNRHIHKAEISRGNKRINVFLTAVPFELDEENLEDLLPIFLN